MQHGLNSELAVAETAIGLVPLIGAGLLIRSFIPVFGVEPDFILHHVQRWAAAVVVGR